MPILKKIYDNEFTVIPNTLAQNKELSYDARGLLIELLSRPENWVVHKTQLISSDCGITIINRIFKELKDKGFLKIENIRSDNKIVDRVWTVSAEPIFLKSSTIGFLNLSKPQDEQTSIREDLVLQNKDKVQKKDNNKIKNTPVYTLNDIEYMLSELLLVSIQCIKPNFQGKRLAREGGREDLLQKWSYDFKLILNTDAISIDRLEKVIDYVESSANWRPHILSPAKLRERFEEIEIHMQREKPASLSDCSELCQKLIRSYGLKILGNSRFQPSNGQISKFIQGVEKLKEYSIKKRIIEENMVEYAIEALIGYWTNRGDPIQAGCICSDFTWGQLVPQYVKQLGL